MRVLYLSAAAALGGAERSLLDCLASLRQARPSWTLHLLGAANGPLVDRAMSLGVTAEVVEFSPALARLGEGVGVAARLGGLARAWAPARAWVEHLKASIARVGPDIVHSNGVKMHVLGALGRTPGVALVWHLHEYIGLRPITSRLLRRYAVDCAAIVANSGSVAVDARQVLGPAVPITTVHNAVDLERFTAAGPRVDLDALAGLPPAGTEVVRVGLVGTFGRWKGHATFLDAIARLPNELPVRAFIVGGAVYQTDGSQHTVEDLRRRAAALGLQDRVGFTGFVENPEDALRALDIVVHASTAPEPFGLVIAEAMACGRAVIASEAGGAREIFTPGVDALAHAPGDAGSLAARIAELARDPGLRLRLGRAGRETAERRFDRARLAAELQAVYARAVDCCVS